MYLFDLLWKSRVILAAIFSWCFRFFQLLIDLSLTAHLPPVFARGLTQCNQHRKVPIRIVFTKPEVFVVHVQHANGLLDVKIPWCPVRILKLLCSRNWSRWIRWRFVHQFAQEVSTKRPAPRQDCHKTTINMILLL